MSATNDKDMSRHILPTSSNLLGLCFVIVNFVKIWKVGRIERVVVDKMVGVSMLFFLVASVLSYASIRSKKKGESYEKAADIIFLVGLVSLAVIAAFCTFEIM